MKRSALLSALALALAACGGSDTSSSSGGSSTTRHSVKAQRAPSVAVSAGQLRALAASAGHPIFWAGPASGRYELTRIADGRTYIRYLPSGVPVGSTRTYLTIGTYVRPTAPYASVRQSAAAKRARVAPLKGGGLAVQYPTRPQSVYLVFPGARYEVEIYDPVPATAFRLATSGKVVPVP